MRRRAPIAALACLMVGHAPAMAGAGMIFAFQGESWEFALDDPQSRAGFTRFMSVDAVSFEGVAGAARLVVQLSLPPGGSVPHDARILYLPDGWRDYWVSPLVFPQGGVVVEGLQLSGDQPFVAGHFAVDLCFTRSPMHLPDPEDCAPAEGRFQTPLRAER